MNGKSTLTAVLAVCYIGACVGSLWDRGDAILPLLLIIGLYSFYDIPPTTVVIYTVGYPFYLTLFFLTWLFGGHDPDLSDS